MKSLRISDTLSLPLNYATKTAAILAQRRKGKTYTASVIAEEMVAAKQPFVALDPTGAWWGLRASADGKSAGLPVIILGGQHGDVGLERTGGRVVADLVVDEPGFYVIDFSLFESGEAERQFAVDFAERLYRAKAQPGKNFPLHLFVDEADRFIPQNLSNKSETSPRLLGAFEAIVRRGGLRGLGTTLISQRAAVVNKNVLEMLDVLFALRTLGPNDQKAIKGYVSAHGSEAELAAISGSLASLAIGEAWVWEPGAEPALFQRVQIRKRETFNSSATPDAAHRPVDPKQLAAVDLQALNKRMADTIERAKADDPKELKKQLVDKDRRIKELERVTSGFASSSEGKKTEAPILTDADRELVKQLRDEFLIFSENIGAKADVMLTSLAERAKASIDDALKVWTLDVDRRRELFAKRLESARVNRLFEKLEQVQPSAQRHTPSTNGHVRALASAGAQSPGSPAVAREPRPSPAAGPSGGNVLGKGERTVLIAVAQHDDGVTREQLTVLTGYKKSSRDTYLQKLQQRGVITPVADRFFVTPEGMSVLGDDFELLPKGAALLKYWLGRLGAGERTVLAAIVAYGRAEVARDVITDDTGYKKSSRDTYIQKLAARRLVVVSSGGVSPSTQLFD